LTSATGANKLTKSN